VAHSLSKAGKTASPIFPRLGIPTSAKRFAGAGQPLQKERRTRALVALRVQGQDAAVLLRRQAYRRSQPAKQKINFGFQEAWKIFE